MYTSAFFNIHFLGAQLITESSKSSLLSPPLTFESPSAGGKKLSTGKKWRTQKGQIPRSFPEFFVSEVDSWNSEMFLPFFWS